DLPGTRPQDRQRLLQPRPVQPLAEVLDGPGLHLEDLEGVGQSVGHIPLGGRWAGRQGRNGSHGRRCRCYQRAGSPVTLTVRGPSATATAISPPREKRATP